MSRKEPHVPVPPGAACFECEAPAQHMHHVVPYSVGGRRVLPLCESCHGKVHGYEMAGHGAAIRTALAGKRERGEMTGAPRFGERLGPDGVHVEPDPSEQATIALARTLRASGLSHRAIQEDLAERGVAGRRGRPLTLTTVHAITKGVPRRAVELARASN